MAKAQSVDPDRIPRILLAALYPKQVWYFLAACMALVSLCHVISVLYAYHTRQHVSKPTTEDGPLRHRLSWRRLPLAAVNLYRIIAFRWSLTLPGNYTFNVADFMLTTTYITIIFTWSFINSTNTLGQKYDPKYWANRCAHIAGVQLPLMTALGMKNNFISFLTGVSFDKLEYLHRLSARVIMVLFWAHAFGRVALEISPLDAVTPWFRIGVAGASALTILCLLSIRPLRTRNYEFFLALHLLLGVLALAGAYVHAGEFGYEVYIWPALFLWGVDRVFRLLRGLLVNAQFWAATGEGKKKKTMWSTASVCVLSNDNFLRILVDAPPYFLWRPGQSAYLTLAGAQSIAEAHPFTIAYSTREEKDEGRERLAFILRVRTGFTRRLLKSVLSSSPEGNSKEFKAFLDGPYGSPPVVRGYERVVFICGGSGVSFGLPLLLDLLQANDNPRLRRILFVWAIRDRDQIEWMKEPLTRSLTSSSKLDVEIRLHLTSAPEDTQVAVGDDEGGTGTESPASSEEKQASSKEQPLPGVPTAHLLRGRPDIKAILDTEVDGLRGGAVSVNVCGTPQLGTSVRRALASPARFMDVMRGGPSVVLHVEGFGGTGVGSV
ncbi:iron reductase [Roridomyces roridus]|uniref:Iron reductase n=1 Tax=Roridomyces roridus TaxID=1738132 RepID=A0AAD7BPB5_9AGAR|nr:iron reductase [Roridomyces roridus]